MNERFLQDWGEYLVGIPALLISIFVAIWIYYQQNRQKSLSYSYKTNNLINYDNKIQENIEVIYEGKKIKNLTSITIKFTNSGNMPIKKGDFEDKLGIIFEKDSINIISKELDTKKPENLKVKFDKNSSNAIFLDVGLLNPKDFFSLIILADIDGDPKIKINTRIVGVRRIINSENIRQVQEKTKSFVLGGFAGLIFCVLIIALFIPTMKDMLFLVCTLTILAFLLFTAIRYKVMKNSAINKD